MSPRKWPSGSYFEESFSVLALLVQIFDIFVSLRDKLSVLGTFLI